MVVAIDKEHCQGNVMLQNAVSGRRMMGCSARYYCVNKRGWTGPGFLRTWVSRCVILSGLHGWAAWKWELVEPNVRVSRRNCAV